MAKARSGGGETMNKNVRPGVKWGKDTLNKYSPAGVSQIGTAVDPKAVKAPIDGKAKDFVELGNKVALNVGPGGPGTGRTVYASGSQMQYGTARGPEKDTGVEVDATRKGREILGGFGPDYKGGGRGL